MSLLELDPRSIAATITLSGLLLAVVIAAMQTSGAQRPAGIQAWFWACVCATLGLGQSAWLPAGHLFIAHVVGNMLLHLAATLIWLGARQYAGKPAPVWVAWVAVLFTAAWGWQFGVVAPNHPVRVATFSLFLSAWCMAGAWTFFSLREEGAGLARWMTGLPLLVFGALMIVRASSALLFGAATAANVRTPMNAATHLLGSMVLMSTMVGIIILLNARLSAEVRRLAFEDMLTGAASRRGLYEALPRWLTRQLARGHPSHVALIDLDHFKAVNDRLGHAAGDTVLKQLVALCRQQAPADAVVARLGGDEFAVLLPSGLAREQVQAWCSELQSSFDTHMHTALDMHGLPQVPGLSIGWSAIAAPNTEAFDLALREADAQLYRQKAGRRQSMRYLRSAPAPLT
jgi:diguanylate cyclase (GGDEF)-like protein